MEITLGDIASIVGLLLGGGGLGFFFTWRYTKRQAKAEAVSAEASAAKEMQDVYQQIITDIKNDREDQKAYISELKTDRRTLREERDNLSTRIDKMEQEQAQMRRDLARNGRMVESMRPFMCGDMKCKKRVKINVSSANDEQEGEE